MSLFAKNPNETAYVGGKKHWTDVIKNSGPGELLIWRQPEEDFNTNSTLIVMPGEEAIFIKGGNVESVFDSGTYKLTTENYPFISRLRNASSGGISAFNCVVYFVRKAHSMELYWGTESPIQVRDPVLGIATSVQARGAYKIQVENGVTFLTKLLGNNVNIALQDDLYNYFSSQFQQHIKSNIARYIKSSNQEIMGICSEQDVLADAITPILADIIAEYGLKLCNFSIMGLDVPENDPNRKMLEEAFAQKGTLNILGNDWAKIQSRDILRDLANNPGAGGAGAMMGGMGMGMAAGSVFNSMAQQMFAPMGGNVQQPQQPQQPQFQQRGSEPQQAPGQPQGSGVACSKCGAPLVEGAKFCMGCGTPVQDLQPKKQFCPNCGKEITPGAKFCMECGTQIKI